MIQNKSQSGISLPEKNTTNYPRQYVSVGGKMDEVFSEKRLERRKNYIQSENDVVEMCAQEIRGTRNLTISDVRKFFIEYEIDG